MFENGARLLDRYEVRSHIARGGMADVFLAADARLGRNVAIKAFRIGTSDPRRFEAETKILANLVHRNLVRLYDAGEHEGVPFVVLEHVDGPTLATRLAEGPLAADHLRRVGADLARGLAFVHERRVVHRDVKPSNVLLAPDGRAILGDFGVAVLLDATRLTTDAATVGTAAYLAPEQVSGEAVTSATDVYALGLVLLEAATAATAFTGSFHEILAAKLRADPVIPAAVDHDLRLLLARMVARDPAERPSAAHVADALDARSTGADATVVAGAAAPTQILERSTVVATPAGPGAPTGRRELLRGRRLAIASAGIAVALALGIGAAALVGGDPSAPDPPADDGSATTSAPAVPPTAVAPPTTSTSKEATCGGFEDQKREIEAAKREAEQAAKDDKDALEDLKENLDAQKKAIEQQKQAAGC